MRSINLHNLLCPFFFFFLHIFAEVQSGGEEFLLLLLVHILLFRLDSSQNILLWIIISQNVISSVHFFLPIFQFDVFLIRF